jgi:hypothetical protein
MKTLFLGLALFLPIFCSATGNSIEFELIRTTETPGFFAVTIFPEKDAQPIQENITFVKNFSKKESKIYKPVVNFLSELGANVTDDFPEKNGTVQIITLGEPLPNSENFSVHDKNTALEQFEIFSLQNLKPVFFKNLRAEFGGNISAVEQSQKNIIGDQGVTFIGKFKEDMRTRMAIIADDEKDSLQFEAPLDLSNKDFSFSPIAKVLPQLWEQLHEKKRLPNESSISFFSWILGGLGLLIFVIIFVNHSRKKYNEFMDDQNKMQEEFPWKTVSSKEDNVHNNPFEVE